MSDKDKVIEAFKNSEEPLNAKKVSELSGVSFFILIFFHFFLMEVLIKF